MRSLTLTATVRNINGTVALPLSKSISNRALAISWLSHGQVNSGELSAADDTVLFSKLLKQVDEGRSRELHAANAGTVFRFLTAMLAVTPGEWILDGDQRMRKRPIGPLVDALRQLGAAIDYLGNTGYPPIRIRGEKLKGGRVTIAGNISSQFISSLLMIGPVMEKGIDVFVEGEIVSSPYLWLTMDMMKHAGISIRETPSFRVIGNPYKPTTLPSATDWSSASPWYALMALADKGSLILRGLEEKSRQADSALAEFFIMFGIESRWVDEGVLLTKRKIIKESVNFDLSLTPDIAPSIIVTAAALGYKGHFTGLKTLRIKESDRVDALSAELGKNGFICQTTADTLSFPAQELVISKAVDTYQDHRIAMAFAPLALLGKPLVINDPEVVKKSYPGFWEEMAKLVSIKNEKS